MKKIFVFLMTIFAVFGLASCGEQRDPYQLIKTDTTPLYTNWFGNIDYKDAPIPVKDYSTKNTRYEIFLPKDIEGTSRYASSSLEKIFEGRIKNARFGYWAMYNLSNVTNEIVKQVSSVYETEISKAYTNITPENYTDKWFTELNIDEVSKMEAVEGKERGFTVLYLPIKINFFLEKENEDAVNILQTYAVVPVYYELTYLTNGKTDSKSFTNYQSVELNIGADGILDSASEK